MKKNDNIEIPQRGRPKKNHTGSLYTDNRIFETEKTCDTFDNNIFENRYDLEKCDSFTEGQVFDNNITYAPIIHESEYEYGFGDAQQDAYMYNQKPYESDKFEQGLHTTQNKENYRDIALVNENYTPGHIYFRENSNNYFNPESHESTGLFKDDSRIFKCSPETNYGTIEDFDNAKFYNFKRKEQKNLYSYADHFMNPSWMNRKKRKNNPFVWQYPKNNDNPQIIPPSEYSSVDYVNSLDNSAQKMYIGTIKRPAFTEKNVSNNTILPLFLNSSSHYDSSASKQEFDKIACAFMAKTECLDYENVTVQQLKLLMKEFGLSHTGKKQELIERMKHTAGMIRDKIKNRLDGDIEKRTKEKREIAQKPGQSIDNETQGFDYLFF